MGSAPAQIPTSLEFRVCLGCSLVQTYDKFRESGCQNCPFFKMKEDHKRIADYTTPFCNGINSVMDPKSWGARRLPIDQEMGRAMQATQEELAALRREKRGCSKADSKSRKAARSGESSTTQAVGGGGDNLDCEVIPPVRAPDRTLIAAPLLRTVTPETPTVPPPPLVSRDTRASPKLGADRIPLLSAPVHELLGCPSGARLHEVGHGAYRVARGTMLPADRAHVAELSLRDGYQSGLHSLIWGTQTLALVYDHVRELEAVQRQTENKLKSTSQAYGTMKKRATKAEARAEELFRMGEEAKKASKVLSNTLAASEERASKTAAMLKTTQNALQEALARHDEVAAKAIEDFKASSEFRKFVLGECDGFFIQGFTEARQKALVIDPNFPVERLKYVGEDDECKLTEHEEGGSIAERRHG
ncbi:Transcription elongation factor SPT4-like [Quillaja saponaria]|uniref:Transcription elongation factor SPT4-like n=1 Tax=Quillaja saponaria TaxID=32244 RepID=A0AAD7P5H3_QUISA|nr:Transcription elongation factor SPT4-like [Quillaja saponaria]